MVGDGRVANILRRLLGHVTLNAIVGRHCGLSLDLSCAATIRCVAGQTSSAKKADCLLAVELYVRVVTGDAPQTATAASPASAHLHLLKLIQRHKMISLDGLRHRKYRHHIAERGSGTKIEIILPRLKHASVSRKMALGTNIIANLSPQLLRIHYGEVDWP
jgi:hypothetical protein